MRHWYLVHSKPRRERAALANLERQGYRAYLPLMRSRRRIAGRYQSRVEAMFPRYLFLDLDDTVDDWGPIRSTVGVSQLVRFGPRAARVPDALVQALKAREDVKAEINRQVLATAKASSTIVRPPRCALCVCRVSIAAASRRPTSRR